LFQSFIARLFSSMIERCPQWIKAWLSADSIL